VWNQPSSPSLGDPIPPVRTTPGGLAKMRKQFEDNAKCCKRLDVMKRARAVLAQPSAGHLDKDLLQDGAAAQAEAEDELQGRRVSFFRSSFNFPSYLLIIVRPQTEAGD
jgi:hypothetical protein